MKTLTSTSFQGTGGRIKRLYSDFIVQEITTDNRVCEIKNIKGEFNQCLEPTIPENPENKEYIVFDFEKTNTDLNFFIKKFSRFLGVSNKRIGYAGLKDKRGITCQRLSIWKPNIERLALFHGKGVEIRNLSWENKGIDIGTLKGNKFTVVVRDVDLTEEELRKRIENGIKEINDKGIANYFGYQRFGGIRKVTHLVGKHLVKNEIDKAVMTYLTLLADEEADDITTARKNLAESNDFSTALKEFPQKFRFERAMLSHLVVNPNDFAGAFGQMPKKMRFLFTHAYQSYIFNEIIRERINQGLGLNAIDGEPVNEQGTALGLLPGYESEFSEGKIGEIEKKILKKEGVKFSDFKMKTLSECSSRGSRKEIVLHPKNIKLITIEEDSIYEGKLSYKLSFDLSKGNYASTVLTEFIKKEKIDY